jgi:hypothetical protein
MGSKKFDSTPALKINAQDQELVYSIPLDSGISMVVPAWKLLKLLEREDVKQERRGVEDAIAPPPTSP